MKQFLILLLTMIAYGCQNTTTEIQDEENSVHAEEKHNHIEESLKLNNNEHWEVVPDMMNYLTYMKEDLVKFEGKTLEDFQELSTDLLINVDLLTANCTMKGEAHDQLHLWLVPYIELVNKFSTAETVAVANQYYIKLQNSFSEFDKYFR